VTDLMQTETDIGAESKLHLVIVPPMFFPMLPSQSWWLMVQRCCDVFAFTELAHTLQFCCDDYTLTEFGDHGAFAMSLPSQSL
jgi:hypothetical protein